MAHGRPRLNVYGRQLLVDRVLRQGWSVAAAAEALQVSRQTGYRWLRRYRAEGPAGLRDRPPIARRRPHALPRAVEQRILRARHQHRWGPHRLAWHLGLPRSTIYGVLRRHRCRGWPPVTAPPGGPCAIPASSPASCCTWT